MRLTARLGKGFEWGVGGDGRPLRRRESATPWVRVVKVALVWVYGLPVSPQSVHIGVVQHANAMLAESRICEMGYAQERIKSRKLGSEELATAASVPMYPIVHLLQADAAISG